MILPYVIWPLRFSPNAPAMIDFYTRLGLHKSFSHDNGTFATFLGRSGTLGVHDALNTESGVVPRPMAKVILAFLQASAAFSIVS